MTLAIVDCRLQIHGMAIHGMPIDGLAMGDSSVANP
jgi:hypothetical protein